MKQTFLLIVLSAASFLAADELTRMRSILETPKATYAELVDLLAMDAGVYVAEESGQQRLTNVNAQYNVGLSGELLNRPLTRASLSGVLHNLYPVPKGVMYYLTHSGHYAYRDFQAAGLFAAAHGPYSALSGSELIGIFDEIHERYQTGAHETPLRSTP